mmetsp:Transcript_31072/g.62720  ORF Transcript_31072/g.62720 Transcript_31072/m.62720 type:complete len:83 (+) Transcript_31072:316-564(+)
MRTSAESPAALRSLPDNMTGNRSSALSWALGLQPPVHPGGKKSFASGLRGRRLCGEAQEAAVAGMGSCCAGRVATALVELTL